MSPLWEDGGEHIHVEMGDTGTPVRFAWEGQYHDVDSVANHWRIDEDWWRQRIWREYYKLTTHSGLLVLVYCNLVNGEWFLQRLYD
jgi:hypothetical protein